MPSPPRYPSPGPRQPRLAPRDEDEMINGLRAMIGGENDVEREKINLALKPDFNMVDAFQIFDTNRDG